MNSTGIIIFELLINFFESYLMIDFISKFNGFKYLGTKRYILYFISILILFVNICIGNYINLYVEIPSYIAFFVMLLYSVIALKGKILIKFLSCVIINVMLILINSASIFILSIIFRININIMINTFSIYRFILLIISKIILFYVIKIVLKFKVNKQEKAPKSFWILITVIPLLTIFIMVTITETAIHSNNIRVTFYLFISILGLIIINIIFYYLFVEITKEYEIITENKLLRQNLELQHKHSIEIKNLYQNIQTIRHDMKNQLISICSYLENNNCENSLKYVNNIIEEIEVTKRFVFTKNEFFNAIVNNKFSKANSKGIKTSYQIDYEIEYQIDNLDINIILGNLLDNAIEACESITGNKEIFLLISKRWDYILIEVKNTIEKSVLNENPELYTTKPDKMNHGLGIRSIENVIKKYDGMINYSEKGNTLSCDILLIGDD